MVECLVRVADDGEVGELHHRAVAIGVDADDVLGCAEACSVLHGTADAERHVQVGIHHDTGGADLTCVRRPAAVGDHPRGAGAGADERSNPCDLPESGGVVEPGTAGDDARRLGEIDARRIRWLRAEDARIGAVVGAARGWLDGVC